MRFTTHFGLHSQAIRLQGGSYHNHHYPHRPCTFFGQWPQSRELRVYNSCRKALLHTTVLNGITERFGAGLFLIHSPLLKESLLVSFPPPSYMLKFSGCSHLSRGQTGSWKQAKGQDLAWINENQDKLSGTMVQSHLVETTYHIDPPNPGIHLTTLMSA